MKVEGQEQEQGRDGTQRPQHAGLNDLLILDRTAELDEDVLDPFALEELLCRSVGEGGPPLLHMWRHRRGFVMGLRDSRLPGARDAARWLEADGYSVAVRNSGGAAVPLDEGVVNVSIILPKAAGQIDFHDDFELMYELIALALQETGAGVDKGEIDGAYCPGDFDLSIGGRKFCGIAQRRQLHGYVVQAFVIAAGSGGEKAGLARQFYERAGAGAPVGAHPQVAAHSMASLAELLGPERFAGADAFIDAVKRVVRERQSAAGLADAAARLRLPSEADVREMVARLRARYGLG
ncbi:lipoyl protein ligase domain-containing protein [Paenibacillus sp. YYML68]|uniref:lipoate--protein ligase family protein n=1 Tax=Paenibacillus sp. YYML68 TaxID=2909250 RepID=UPI002492BF31|nr:lipoate--protein ligase family protein [Paenibacillus sp. YYML68]